MRDLVAGIDSSTQSCTVLLRRLDNGEIVGEARAPHPATTPPKSEQDPNAWWSALLAAFAELADQLDRVAAVSVGGQGHGLVLLDAADAPLRPAKLWNDTESAPDAERLCAALEPKQWAARTGSVPGPALTVSKLAWTERCHPGLVARAAKVMLPADFIVYRLTGEAVTERGGSSGTGYFNPFDNVWDPALAEQAVSGIDWAKRLPRVIGSGEAAGRVQRLAGLEGLCGAVVGAGTGDNMTAALGMAVEEGDTVVSIGTSGTVYRVTSLAIRDETGAINGYADATGHYMPMVTTLNAAKVTDMVRRLLGVTPDAFDALVLGCRPGARATVMVPYLDGERTPNLPDATGWLGYLRSDTTPEMVARAAVEGVLCGLLEGRDLITRQGVEDERRLILTGGAARSAAYRQVLADLSGRDVWVCPIAETAAAGAAVQAAAALTGEPIDAVARRWAVPLEHAATPGDDGQKVRAAYRQTLLRVGLASGSSIGS